jgi:hypothetical protein
MSRLVSAAALIYDQIDLYSAPNVRATGVFASAITVNAFVNNIYLPWAVVDGTTVADSAITAGVIYFNQITGSPGFYAIRFFPDMIGYWRLIFEDTALSTEVIKDYDVVPARVFTSVGGNSLNASFVPGN